MTMCSSPLMSKPSIRKHSSSEKLSVDHIHIHQENQHLSVHLAFPSSHKKSPSPKAIIFTHTCLCSLLLFFFFFLTLLAFLHSMDLSEFSNYNYNDTPTPTLTLTLTPTPTKPTHNTTMATSNIMNIGAPALKGLGIVFRRGTNAMNELVVAHIPEHTRPSDFRLSLRTLHRSGLTSRADLVFLFDTSHPSTTMFYDIIHQEDTHFHNLLSLVSQSPQVMSMDSNASIICPFNFDSFKAKGARDNTNRSSSPPPTLWGAPVESTRDNNFTSNDDPLSSFRWGSIVGFDVSELTPEDALQGFIDQPPLALRRWACYQMLLGMVRHKFKHVLLTHMGGVVVLGDPLALPRRKLGLYVPLEDRTWGISLIEDQGKLLNISDAPIHEKGEKTDGGMRQDLEETQTPPPPPHPLPHVKRGGKRRKARSVNKVGTTAIASGLYEKVYGQSMWRNLEEVERTKKLVNGGVISGGIQQIRGLANAMVIEIVKVSLERKSREAFPDSVLLTYLLHKSSIVLGKRVLDHIHLMENSESFVHSLVASRQPSNFFKKSKLAYSMVHGNVRSKRWANVARALHNDICSSRAEAMVYNDCSKLQSF